MLGSPVTIGASAVYSGLDFWRVAHLTNKLQVRASLSALNEEYDEGFQQTLTAITTECSQKAGLKSPPEILQLGCFDPLRNFSKILSVISESTVFPNGLLVASPYILQELTIQELRSFVGHEITHLAIGSGKRGAIVSHATHFGLRVAGFNVGVCMLSLNFARIIPAIISFAGFGFAYVAVRSMQSRQQEYIADRGSVFLTGNGEALISGLSKLENAGDKTSEPKAAIKSSLFKKTWMALVSSHPQMPKRFDRIRRTAAELGQTP
jgi:Zn-dependent protease with chaperone function